MTRIALPQNDFNQDHLNQVVCEMKELGAPIIKAVWMECYNHFAAVEGCHRIRASKILGLTPIIEEIEYSDGFVDGMDGDWNIEQICDSSFDSEVFEF